MNKKYYVYAYLDPQKHGIYKYGKYQFDYEPYYIGKGLKERCYKHLCECNLNEQYDKNKHKTRRIKKLIRLGYTLTDYIIKIKENISNKQALELERKLIKIIGRDNIKTGPLLNLTEGGENPPVGKWLGKKHKPESIEKMRNYHLHRPKEITERMSETLKKIKPEQRKEVRKLYKKGWSQYKIAEKYKVDQGTISRVITTYS